MEADHRLLSTTQLQKLAQPHLHHQQPQENPPSWMWNTQQKNQDEDDDSWEVRAFAQDTGNIMGTTWPPRSYTCTFCRREFRSAQALGGHMNVHRRDRAKLRQSPPSADAAASTIIFPSQEFVAANGGVCLVYSLPNNPNTAVFSSAIESPSTLLSISPYQNSGPPSNFTPPTSMKSSLSQTGRSEEPNLSDHYHNQDGHIHNSSSDEEETDDMVEELDLELRLGARPSSSPSPHNKVY